MWSIVFDKRTFRLQRPANIRADQTFKTRIRELLVAGGAALKRIHGPMELAGGLGPGPGSYPKLRGRRSFL